MKKKLRSPIFSNYLLFSNLIDFFYSLSDDRQRNTVFQAKIPNNEPRPHFTSKIENVTVNVGREAILECHVNNLGRYKVNILFFHNFTPEV